MVNRRQKREIQLPRALQYVQSEKFKNIAKTADIFRVSKDTLRRQLENPTSPAIGQQHRQRLNLAEERGLSY
jgi:DeoR/GlpR family transcriptional regulator of sugar metabolism